MTKLKTVLITAVSLIWAATSSASGPDVIVGGVGEGGISNDFQKYDTGGSVIAYSFSTTSCNQGDSVLLWQAGNNQHPVIGQSMYRLKDGRFEQLGQSWLKHGFCALSQNFCGLGCSSTSCSTLGVGCSDPYTASRNAASGLGPKSQVNAATGSYPYPPSPTSGGSGINGRLQVRRDDVTPAMNPGALYFVEAQYVTADDAASGNKNNNASYRPISFNASLNVSFLGSTMPTLPAIRAWRDQDALVKLGTIDVPNDGRLYLASRTNDNGDGTWHYEYAVQNLSSDRCVGSVAIGMTDVPTITNIGFHDVDYHSGEPYSGADWGVTIAPGTMIWETQDFSQNPNANAIRWGTLYNFRYDADTPPVTGSATIGLFKPGTPSAMIFNTQVPAAPDPDPVPSAPTNMAAANNISCDTISLSWDSAKTATNIEVYRNSVDDSGTATLIDTLAGTAVDYDDTLIGENGSTWFYWVKACNSNGCSDFSSPTTSATLQVKGDFEPNGVFNGLDVNGFAAAAIAGDACADLAAPFGTIDDADAAAMAGLLVP